MDTARIMVGLAIQVGYMLRHFWFISLVIAVVAAAAFVWLYRRQPITDGARLASWLCMTFPLGMLIFGSLFSRVFQSAAGLAVWAVVGPLFLLVIAYMYAIARAKRQRMATSAMAAL